MHEIIRRLMGEKASDPSSPDETRVWVATAEYLTGRIQGDPAEKPGREPDMSVAASAATRAVLEPMRLMKSTFDLVNEAMNFTERVQDTDITTAARFAENRDVMLEEIDEGEA